MLVLHDEQITKRLEEISVLEQRPIDEIVKSLLEQYQPHLSPALNAQPTIQLIRQKAYTKARRYWHEVGDAGKAGLTDVEMDAQFGCFDENDIPRLKSELVGYEPQPGTLAYAGKIARQAEIVTQNSIDASQTDSILNTEFPDYLLNRSRGQNASE